MGTTSHGFKIVRGKNGLSAAPWLAAGIPDEKEYAGDPRLLSDSDSERLLSETVLYFPAAALAVDPFEKAGPPPRRQDANFAEWLKAYSAAGGPPMDGEHDSIEIRISTQDGVKKHLNRFDHYDVPADFWPWLTAFGTVKTIP